MSLPVADIKSNAGSAMNKISQFAGQSALHFSKDFIVQYTAHGLQISLKPRITHNFDGMKYQGEFDPTRSYDSFDFCRVLSGSNYTITGSTVSASVGTWVCVVPVPSFGVMTGSQNQMRQAQVTYYPQSPESSSYANPYSTGSDAVGRFWEQIGQVSTGSVSTPWFKGDWNTTQSFNVGDGIRLRDGTVNAGTYVCVTANTNQYPVYPEPTTGSVYWVLLSLGVSQISVPYDGTGKTVYINSTPPF